MAEERLMKYAKGAVKLGFNSDNFQEVKPDISLQDIYNMSNLCRGGYTPIFSDEEKYNHLIPINEGNVDDVIVIESPQSGQGTRESSTTGTTATSASTHKNEHFSQNTNYMIGAALLGIGIVFIVNSFSGGNAAS